jgi:polyphosphate kinase 2
MSRHFAIEVPDAPAIEIDVDGKKRKFDLDEPDLPDWVKKNDFTAGNFPYTKKLDKDDYEKQLEDLQMELVKVLFHLQKTGERILAIFEGRDAAGKGGTIARFREFLNPRYARSVALAKPSDTERGQWYFQRYAHHFPTSGEFVFFDRSWYNRAGVEPVMGFCTPEQHEEFLREVPLFEHLLVNSGIRYFKFWLNIGRETQLKRFHDRRHDPLKIWKLSPIDIKALEKWDDYTKMRDLMFNRTDSEHAPWTVIRANDKRRARINAIRTVLHSIDYDGKDKDRIGETDDLIVRPARDFND